MKNFERKKCDLAFVIVPIIEETIAANLETIELDKRHAVIFSPYDLSCGLENFESLQFQGYAREDANSPYAFYYEQMRAKMKRGKRLYVFKSHKDQADETITHDYVMDHCVIYGSVNKVVDRILALREEIGPFGELVYAGMDWVDPALNKRSMQLMAEEVMPRVNAAIKETAAAA